MMRSHALGKSGDYTGSADHHSRELFSIFTFINGSIRDKYSFLFKSEEASTIVNFEPKEVNKHRRCCHKENPE